MQPMTSSYGSAVFTLRHILDEMQSYSAWVNVSSRGDDFYPRNLIDRIEQVKNSLSKPFDEQRTKTLQLMIPQLKLAFNEKMKYFKSLPVYVKMQINQIVFYQQLDYLSEKLSRLAFPVILRPDLFPMETDSSRNIDKTSEKRPKSDIVSPHVAPSKEASRLKRRKDEGLIIMRDLDSLPNEMIESCIRDLPFLTLIKMRVVSKKFKEIVDHFLPTLDGQMKLFCEVSPSQKQVKINQLRTQWLHNILINSRLDAQVKHPSNANRFFGALRKGDRESLPLHLGKKLLLLIFKYAHDTHLHQYIRMVAASSVGEQTPFGKENVSPIEKFINFFLDSNNDSNIERLLTLDPDTISPFWVAAGNLKESHKITTDQKKKLFLTIFRSYQSYPHARIWKKMRDWTVAKGMFDLKMPRPRFSICADLLASEILCELQKDYQPDLKHRIIALIDSKSAGYREDYEFPLVKKVFSQFAVIPERQKLTFARVLHHFRCLAEINPEGGFSLGFCMFDLDTLSGYEFNFLKDIPDEHLEPVMQHVHTSKQLSEGGHFRTAFEYVRKNYPHVVYKN